MPINKLEERRNANGSGGFCSVLQKPGIEKLRISFFDSFLKLVRFVLGVFSAADDVYQEYKPR